jgi:hypothetical protein
MSKLAVESAPDVAAAAHDAGRGQAVHITERGNRAAGIVPVELAAILDRLTTDELDQLAAAADLAGLINAAGLLEDLADQAAVVESRAAPGTGVRSKQLGVSYQVTYSERASKHLRQLDKPVRKRVADASTMSPGNPGHQAWNPLSACLASSEAGRAAGASCIRLTTITERSGSRTWGAAAGCTAATETHAYFQELGTPWSR